MKKQKITSLILSAAIACTTMLVPVAASAETLDAEMTGKIVQFGEYYGNPVNYKIGGTRDVDGDGTEELFLYSEKIISFKEWNVSGGADWRISTLRTWLNSAAEKVTYQADNTPAYAEQKGFLAHLTDAERQMIVPETHKTLIHLNNNPDGGTGNIGWNDKWPACYTVPKESGAWDTAAYVMTTDSVFIPSIEDMYLYEMELSNNMAQADAALVSAGGETVPSGTLHLWVRDGHDVTKPRQWYPHNSISVGGMTSVLGIRPCFYIRSGMEIVAGSGSSANPYKIATSSAISGIGLSTADGPADWQDGEVNLSVGFSATAPEGNITVVAARFETVDGKETLADIQHSDCEMTANGGTSFALNIENAENSYMKVMIFDAAGKSLCSAATFGTVPAATAAATTGEGNFYASSKVEGNNVSITGGEKNRSYSNVSVLIYQGEEKETILYANQMMVSDGSFAFEFTAEKAFGASETVGGWYTAVVSSDYAAATIPLQLGIASEALYGKVLEAINEAETDKVAKILSKDEEYQLEYASLEGRDLYLEELKTEGVASAVAAALIEKKPEGGYIEENFKDSFNKIVSECYFDASDAEDKFHALEEERYNTYFGSAELVETETYKLVKKSEDADKLFDELTGAELSEKLEEALILTAVSVAENATQMKNIVTENQDTIGVDFPSGYDSLSSAKLKNLYDKMVGKKYTTLDAIADAFDTAYEAVKKSSNQGGGGGGGSSSGGFGGSVPIAAGNVVTKQESKPSPEQVVFADVETLTWGKTEIKTLTQKGIISGLTATTFGPDEQITREQFAKLVAAAYMLPESKKDIAFADVAEGAWYASAVRSLADAGYISGISETEFGVGKKITRQDLAVILYRVLKNKLSDEVELSFTDNNEISDYAKEAVAALSAKKIINGYSDGSFGAKKEVTRREAAVMLYQALNLAE